MSALLLLLAVIPVILICTFIYLKDKNKEPWGLLFKLFILGCLSCAMVLLISQVLYIIFPFMKLSTDKMTFFQVMLYSFIGVAIVEEFCKWFMTYIGAFNSKAYDEVYDGIVYAVYVSLGFAFVENILYVLGNNSVSLGITRGILAVPGHACDAVFMGYYLSLAKAYSKKGDTKKKTYNLVLSIIAPTILHGIYDFCLFAANYFILAIFVVFVLCLWIFSILKIRKLSALSPKVVKKKKKVKQVSPTDNQASEQPQAVPTAQTPLEAKPSLVELNENSKIAAQSPAAQIPIRFCQKCGAPLATNVCSRCGTTN